MKISLRERYLNAFFSERMNGRKIQVAANFKLLERFVGPDNEVEIE